MLGVSRPIVRDAPAAADQGMVYASPGAPAPSSAPTVRRQPIFPIRRSRRSPISSVMNSPDDRAGRVFRRQAPMRQPRDPEDRLGACRSPGSMSHQLHRTDADFNFHRAVTEAAATTIITLPPRSMRSKPISRSACISTGCPCWGRPASSRSSRAQRHLQGRGRPRRGGARPDALASRRVSCDRRLFEGRALDLSF